MLRDVDDRDKDSAVVERAPIVPDLVHAEDLGEVDVDLRRRLHAAARPCAAIAESDGPPANRE